MEPTEQAIVQGCLQGNARCQEALFKRYYGRVKGICLRYAANTAEAQDLLQESFLKVFQSINLFRAESSLATWISRIAVNHCISHYRKSRHLITEELNADLADEPEEDEVSNLEPGEVIALIQQLPPGYRQILNMYAIDGMSHQTIALQLNISPGTSKSQLSKARRMLKNLMETPSKTKQTEHALIR